MKISQDEDKVVVEGDVVCGSCSGTGLYKGMAEGGAAAVVCSSCDGTGCVHTKVTFTIFKKRKIRRDVTRVYKTAYGYGITDVDVQNKNGTIYFSKAGVAYTDWLKGLEPLPIEDMHCPYMHTNQTLQNHDVNNLYRTRCKDNLNCGSISNCKCFCQKAECWKIFKGNK